MRQIVVMFTPPHYKVHGVPQIWYGRVDKAVDVAVAKHCPMIVAGDANGGKDLDRFFIRARRLGVGAVLRAFNGDDVMLKNTRGDARAIARVMAEVPALALVERVVIVTCWYHVPRAWIALRQELGNSKVKITCAPVWTKLWHGVKALPNEVCGCIDYLRRRPQSSRGEPIGKPDFE